MHGKIKYGNLSKAEQLVGVASGLFSSAEGAAVEKDF